MLFIPYLKNNFVTYTIDGFNQLNFIYKKYMSKISQNKIKDNSNQYFFSQDNHYDYTTYIVQRTILMHNNII